MVSQMHVPQLSKVNKIIIGAYVGLFILSQIILQSTGTSLVQYLGLSVSWISSGAIYQLLTYPLIDVGFTAVLFNALLIWFIGSELEQKWGTSVYVQFLIAATFCSGLAYIALALSAGGVMSSTPFYGLTGVNLALLMAYGKIL